MPIFGMRNGKAPRSSSSWIPQDHIASLDLYQFFGERLSKLSSWQLAQVFHFLPGHIRPITHPILEMRPRSKVQKDTAFQMSQKELS